MQNLNRRTLLASAGAAAGIGAFSFPKIVRAQQSTSAVLTTKAARDFAFQAGIYAYPLVKNYLSIWQFALDSAGGQYKGPPNQVNNVARVFTPADTGVITPNSDTPYSFLILDLRAGPLVVTLPAIADDRYYSLQLVDLYTNNVDYLGTRRDGNGGGAFLIAGPDWHGETPDGIRRVVRFSTSIGFSQFRTQLFAPDDITEVKEIQKSYSAVALSEWAGAGAGATLPQTDWPPISDKSFAADIQNRACFLLQFCPLLPHEAEMRAAFARIGIAPGPRWPHENLPAEIAAIVTEGMAEGVQAVADTLAKVTSSAGLFGTPEEMQGKYLERAVGAMGGIYGNSDAETLYPSYTADASGQPYNASEQNYIMRFAPGTLPPVDAFWSVTMYDLKSQLLIENPLNRYLINSPMLDSLVRDADGGLTLYLQHKSPGPEREANWLPAPDGPMGVVMRLYLPRPEVLDGSWQAPSITPAGAAE